MLTLLLSCRWLHVLACLVLAFLFAIRLTRRIEASLPAFRRLVRRTLPAMAGLVAALIGFSLGGQIPGVRQAPLPTPAVSADGQELQVRMSCWSCSTRCVPTISAFMATAAIRPPICRGWPDAASRSSRRGRRLPGLCRLTPA